jgi:hypothetical protein
LKHQDKTKEKIINEMEQQRRKHAEVEMVTAGNNGLHKALWQEGYNSRYRIYYLTWLFARDALPAVPYICLFHLPLYLKKAK